MPGSITHDRIGLALSPAVGLAAGSVSGGEAAVVAVASYVFGVLWMSPDLDLPSARIDDRWLILKWIWIPYEKAAAHRSFLSHSGVSAFIRLAYLVVALGVMGVAIRIGMGWDVGEFISSYISGVYDVAVRNPTLTVWAMVGLFLSDLVHITADYL